MKDIIAAWMASSLPAWQRRSGKYERVLLEVVYDMMKISKSTAELSNGLGIILSTLHRVNG